MELACSMKVTFDPSWGPLKWTATLNCGAPEPPLEGDKHLKSMETVEALRKTFIQSHQVYSCQTNILL